MTRTATVIGTGDDTLPDLDADDPKAAVIRVLTDNLDKDHDEFWIEPGDAPPGGVTIAYDVPHGLFGTVAQWGEKVRRQRGYSHPSGKSVGGALY